MNRRIRKKKDKKITEAINGLVSIAERREQQRQAAIRQFVKRCEALSSSEKKGGIDAVTKFMSGCRIRAPTGKSITPTLKN